MRAHGDGEGDDQTVNRSEERICPGCGSSRTTFVQRGLAGLTDESDQYYRCLDCERVTYEILSRTEREVRAGRLEPGRTVRERGSAYVVRRVLKVGLNEYLVYLAPDLDDQSLTFAKR